MIKPCTGIVFGEVRCLAILLCYFVLSCDGAEERLGKPKLVINLGHSYIDADCLCV